MAMVAERLREVIEMEAERDAAPPRAPLALVPLGRPWKPAPARPLR